MNSIEFTDDLKNYELTYWNAHKNEENIRSSIMKKLFGDEIIEARVAVDIGCGPHCGIFNELYLPVMYAVDPLWQEYVDNGLDRMVDGVKCIISSAEEFKLEQKADIIFSFNALDHSGSLEDSFNNIMNNLKEEGKFYFHIHLRTKEQLNMGHRMIVLENDIDTILKPYNIINKKILDKCPLDNKNYRSYIAIIKH